MIRRRLPVRRGFPGRPRPGRQDLPALGGTGSTRRASAGLSASRATALLVMILVGATVYGLGATSVFNLRRVEVPDLRFTDPVAIRSNLPVAEGVNLFSLSLEPLVARLLDLPAVAGARIEISLPDRLVVRITERTPILVWQVDQRRYLVDRRGVLFAEIGTGSLGSEAATADLPVINDHRLSSVAALGEADLLDPIVLDAATRLASLRPADIGSAATSLSVEVGDESGFVVRADPTGWAAIFGFYTPTLRTTDLIPGQVRLLRSLLADREDVVARIVLADDTNGTYLPKVTPKLTATPRPTATPKATATPRPTATTRP